jgi:hypothetical protein
MTHAVFVYQTLSQTIEPLVLRRASIPAPELAFGPIGIAAVAAALAASRPAERAERPALTLPIPLALPARR